MSEPTFDALRLACQCDGKSDHHPITPAEFDRIAREQGYVKVDGIDVEAARYFVGRPVAAWMMRASGEVVTPVDVLSRVLAAIDREGA